MMLGRLALAMGVCVCLAGGGRAQEAEPVPETPPPPQFPPPAFATQPRHVVIPRCPACGLTVTPGTCCQRILRWMTYRPLPTTCRGGYFCKSCCGGGGSACGCRQPSPCCSPLLYTFFLDRCACMPPIGLGPSQPPVFPSPGDPPLAQGPQEVLPSP